MQRLELNVGGTVLECHDGDVIGSGGTLSKDFFARAPGFAERHLLIGKQDQGWFILIPRNVPTPAFLDGKDAERGVRHILQGDHCLQIANTALNFSVVTDGQKRKSPDTSQVSQAPPPPLPQAVTAPKPAREEVQPAIKASRELAPGQLDPEFLGTLVNNIHDLIAVVDPQGRRLWNNSAYATVLGYQPDELRGTDSTVELHTDDQPLVKAVLIESMRTGIGRRLEYRMRHKDGNWVILESDGVVLPDWRGGGKCLVIIARDITARKKAEAETQERRQRQLEHATVLTTFASSKEFQIGNVERCLSMVTEAIVRTMGCDRASFWLFESEGAELKCSDLFSKALLQHSTGDCLLSAEYPNYFKNIATQRIIAADRAFEDEALTELRSAYLLPNGVLSKLDVPIRHGDELIGLLACEVATARHWNIDEQNFATSLADLILLAIETQERLRTFQALKVSQQHLAAEVAEAARYVKSLLPAKLTGAIETDWRFIPSTELGGDSFGYHWIDDNHFAFYLLDVVGHGVGAALLSVSALNTLRSQSLPEVDFRDPGQVLSVLNESFQMKDQNEMYFTAWYGVFNREARSISFSSAGHPPAVVITGDTAESAAPIQLKAPGLMIGAASGVNFVSKFQEVGKYCKLYLFSDGAYEVTVLSGPTWTLDEFEQVLTNPPQLCDAELDSIIQQVRVVQAAQDLPDDCSIVRFVFN